MLDTSYTSYTPYRRNAYTNTTLEYTICNILFQCFTRTPCPPAMVSATATPSSSALWASMGPGMQSPIAYTLLMFVCSASFTTIVPVGCGLWVSCFSVKVSRVSARVFVFHCEDFMLLREKFVFIHVVF